MDTWGFAGIVAGIVLGALHLWALFTVIGMGDRIRRLTMATESLEELVKKELARRAG